MKSIKILSKGIIAVVIFLAVESANAQKSVISSKSNDTPPQLIFKRGNKDGNNYTPVIENDIIGAIAIRANTAADKSDSWGGWSNFWHNTTLYEGSATDHWYSGSIMKIIAEGNFANSSERKFSINFYTNDDDSDPELQIASNGTVYVERIGIKNAGLQPQVLDYDDFRILDDLTHHDRLKLTSTSSNDFRIDFTKNLSGTNEYVRPGDLIGQIHFAANHYDDDDDELLVGASIEVKASETYSYANNKAGSRMVFSTAPMSDGEAVETLVLEANGTVNVKRGDLLVSGSLTVGDEIKINGIPLQSSPWVKSGSNISFFDGKVGIGTHSPSEALHVDGNIRVNNTFIGRGPDNLYPNGAMFINTNLLSPYGSDNNYALLQGTDGTTLLNASHNRRIGMRIGDIEQAYIKDGAFVVNQALRSTFFHNTGDNGTATIDARIDGTVVMGGEAGSDDITNASIAASYYSDYALWVKQGIVADDIALAGSEDWAASQPDYVFEEEYELPTLDNVNAFIKENKHLPEIPSKAEVADRGWSLPEMDQKLLKKVEELTLYTIEQDKQIRELREMVEQLISGN